MEIWKQCAEKSHHYQRPGHATYAEKQVHMWEMFVEEGERAFKGVMVDRVVEEGSDDDMGISDQ